MVYSACWALLVSTSSCVGYVNTPGVMSFIQDNGSIENWRYPAPVQYSAGRAVMVQ
jgi:hypothetical protein